jgi:hypothetical protein
MKRLFILLISLTISVQSFGWGKTGHRIIGAIAEMYLTKKARKEIHRIMGYESLSMAANWMDFIKSDPRWDHAGPWHYATIPNGMTYAQAGTPAEGDAIATIERLIYELQTKQFTDEDEIVALRFLIHLIGDLHQPLHTGNGEDRGGNDVKLKWFWQNSNLHRVWDSGIIDGEQLSYSEWVNEINFATNAEITAWQHASTEEWAYESMTYRQQIYNLPEDKSINYRYVYDNIDVVRHRLLQAGIRLAGVLNKIYG